MIPWRHPGARRLELYVDDELSARGRSRVAGHLLKCARCRAEVEQIRELGRRFREASSVDFRKDAVLSRIHRTLADGGAVILPASDAPLHSGDSSRERSRLMAPAVALAAIASLVVLVLTPRLDAHHSHMELSPTAPAPGDVLEIAYRPGLLFDPGRRLLVRARTQSADGAVEYHEVPLTPGSRFRPYRASFQLPSGAVHALFTVEDEDRLLIDSNSNRFWDLALVDGEGRPTFEALRMRVAREVTARTDIALEAARSMVRYHPDRPESWSTLHAVERVWSGPAEAEALAERHRTYFESLEARFRETPPTSEDIGWMAAYARAVGGSAAFAHWRERLLREAPGERRAIQLTIQELEAEHGSDLPRLIEEYERLWSDFGPSEDLTAAAFSAARRLSDGTRALRWGERRLDVAPGATLSVAEALTAMPGAREVGLRLLRSELDQLEGGRDQPRPLGVTAPEHEAERQRRAHQVLAAIGTGLAAAGEHAAAADTLALAGELVWDRDVFRVAADLLLEKGDTVAALAFLARIAADPETTPVEARELGAVAKAHLAAAGWEREIERARVRMSRQVLSNSPRRRLPGLMRVETRDGQTTDLMAGVEGEVTVVALWLCLCEQFRAAMGSHQALAASLEEVGVPVLNVVTGRTPAEPAPSELEPRGSVPPLYDTRGEAQRAFGFAQSPAYSLVDAQRYLRLSFVPPGQVLRAAWALRIEDERAPLVAADDGGSRISAAGLGDQASAR